MKKFCFFALAIITALITLNAQNVIKVVTNDGKTVRYSKDDIVRIEFYPTGNGTADDGRPFTVTPAEGVVKSLSSFEFTFTNYSDIKLADNGIALLYADGAAAPLDYMRPTVSGNTVKATLTKTIEEGGIYSVVIPAGFLTMTETATGEPYTNEEVRVTYQIEGGNQMPPLVGDFYYSDGTWSTSLLKKEGVEPIGIVFYVGINAADNAAYYTTKDGKSMRENFHGYVVSLKDATLDAKGNNVAVAWSFFDGSDSGCGCSVSQTDFMGYTNTAAIKERADKYYGGLSDGTVNFPATYYACVAFDRAVPAPAQSSGWFLPSAGQLDYILNSVYYLTNGMSESTPYIQKSLKTLEDNGYNVGYLDANGTRYWASNEQYDSEGHSYRALRARTGADFSGGFGIEWANKNAGSTFVRAILAF